jgi:pimeloyl-ACP methyl ester carboxylesterase
MPTMQPSFSRLAASFVVSCLMACAHEPPSVHAVAAGHGFVETTIDTRAGFRHLIVFADGSGVAPVRIYIEGDGTPWVGEYVPAGDPSPRTLVALEMMAAGQRPALYVGRPCYFGSARDAGCEPLLWTHGRFGRPVQQSMVEAIQAALARRGWEKRPVVLVGFSGGGTLAALVADALPRTCALVTVASPLDIDEWADGRGYSRLAASDNPAERPPLPASIGQLHLRGGRDRIVASDNGARFFAANPNAVRRVVADAAHGLEWAAAWPAIDRQWIPFGGCGQGR